jgi:hypothetical protein
LKTKGGEVKSGAGNEVFLTLASDDVKAKFKYNQIQMLYLGVKGLPPGLDSTIRNSLIGTTTADANGNFEFKNVPAGEYQLFCEIYWKAGGDTTGGVAYSTVRIGSREVKKVILSETL